MVTTKTIQWNACAVCLLLASASSAFAQRVEVKRVETPPDQAYRAKEVLGGTVSIDGNVSIGKVDDIVFDANGTVEYLIVDNNGKFVTVPWEAARFNFKERTAFVNITPEQFQRVPTYSAEQYPVFSAPTYRVETYKYYGVTPRERRLERRLDRRQ
jgi:hypothetical protein